MFGFVSTGNYVFVNHPVKLIAPDNFRRWKDFLIETVKVVVVYDDVVVVSMTLGPLSLRTTWRKHVLYVFSSRGT